MLGKQPRKNHCYFLCLLDWRDLLLSKDQIDEVAKSLGLPLNVAEPASGWHEGLCPDIVHRGVDKVTLGMAHSRLIFEFELGNIELNNFWQIRRLREELEKHVTEFLERRALPAMQLVLQERLEKEPERGGPRVFVYPVFELKDEDPFWNDLQEEKPFNIYTTCFHARLRDVQGWWRVLGGKTVKMRVSGAKIIATEMSNLFFWELVNIVYYQGLYRQSREPIAEFPANGIHRSLENRLEQFGREFATTFYQLGSGRMLEDLNSRLVFLTMLLVVLTVVILIVTAAT